MNEENEIKQLIANYSYDLMQSNQLEVRMFTNIHPSKFKEFFKDWLEENNCLYEGFSDTKAQFFLVGRSDEIKTIYFNYVEPKS